LGSFVAFVPVQPRGKRLLLDHIYFDLVPVLAKDTSKYDWNLRVRLDFHDA
jgi:hypothetical protein